MKSLLRSLAAVAAVCVMQVAAFAADPSGTWTWTQMGRQGGAGAPQSLVLALKDGKLTGSLTAPGRGGGEPVKVDITNGTFKDDTVTFAIERETPNGKSVTTFTGKLAGDTITGTRTAPGRGGAEPMPVEWVAKKG